MTQSEREAVSKTVQNQIDALRREMQEMQRQINTLQGRDPMRNVSVCVRCNNGGCTCGKKA